MTSLAHSGSVENPQNTISTPTKKRPLPKTRPVDRSQHPDPLTILPDPTLLPPGIDYLSTSWSTFVLSWASALIYLALLKRFSRHHLVRLQRSGFEFTPIVLACAGFHHSSGPGAPPKYSIDTLVRAEIVRIWAGSCSDPKLEEILSCHLIARWFCGLSLFDDTPDHTTLCRFHAWCCQYAPDAFFDNTLAFLDRVDPEDQRTTPQIIDTFALATPAAAQDFLDILRYFTNQIKSIWLKEAPKGLPDPFQNINLSLLAKRPPYHFSSKYPAALKQLGSIFTSLPSILSPLLSSLPTQAQQAINQRLALIQKVLLDETTTDEAGNMIKRTTRPKGTYHIGSALDTEATFRKHVPKPTVFGYNAVISTTTTRIRSAFVFTGSTPDSDAPVALIERLLKKGYHLPKWLIIDRAGSYGKTRSAVNAASAGLTNIVAKLPIFSTNTKDRFDQNQFKISADQKSCVCPNGVKSTLREQTNTDERLRFRFSAKACQGCPLLEKCRTPGSDEKGQRVVSFSLYQPLLNEAEAFNKTEEGSALLKMRYQVEPTIGWLTRYDGARRARRIGKAAAQFHLNQSSTGRNIWRWLARGAPMGE